MKKLFFIFLFSGIFFFGNSAFASTWCGDYVLPYSLPYNDGSHTYTEFSAVCFPDGDWRSLYMSNIDVDRTYNDSPELLYYTGYNDINSSPSSLTVRHTGSTIVSESSAWSVSIPSEFCFTAQDNNIITSIDLTTNDVSINYFEHYNKNCLDGLYSPYTLLVPANYSASPSPTFDLSVVSPVLDEFNEASVNPDPFFYVKLNYSVSGWDLSDVRFWWYQCPDYDHCDSETLTDDDLRGSGLLSDIRAGLGPSEYGNIFVSVPVTLGNHTLLYFKLTTESDTTNRTLATADLLGSETTGLPSATSALSGSYNEVPNILTNPSGFVSALMSNLTVWVRSVFVPSPVFFSSRFGAVEAVAEEHFPILFSIASIVDGSVAVDSSITIGSLDFGGSSSSPLSFFAPGTWNPDTFAGLRSFLSMLMYVWLAYFVVVKLSRIFSS